MCHAREVNARVDEYLGIGGGELPSHSAGAGAANLAGSAGSQLAGAVASGRAGRTRIYLLGSLGGQQRDAMTTGATAIASTSVLVVVDESCYLLDAGPGALLRLNEAGFGPQQLQAVLMTHHHPDHNAGLGSVLSFGWTNGLVDPSRRISVHGPQGTLDYVDGLERCFKRSISEQEALGRKPTFKRYVRVNEFNVNDPSAQAEYAITARPQRLFADGLIAVDAKEVFHGLMPSVAYRLKTPDLDVVFSGDRGPGKPDHFVDFARGTDILFHEIIDLDIVVPVLQALPDAEPLIEHLQREHSAPEVVGNTASAATVGRLVLYHLVPGTPLLADEHWRELVAPYYAGEVVVGRDLLVI